MTVHLGRFTLYSVALGTGLRASELASLNPKSFDLTTDSPTVKILAKSEKARRGDTLPLPADVAELLKSWFESVEPDAKLWPGSWAAHKWASKFIQRDLANARSAWLKTAESDAARVEMEKSGFLSYRDYEGRQADFHALRHTFLSRLGRSGASAKVMQRLARHSTVGLTLDRYTHAGLFDLQAAVDKLPPLPTISNAPIETQMARATGTDTADCLSTVLPSASPERDAKPRVSVPFRAVPNVETNESENEETAEKTGVCSTVSVNPAERTGRQLNFLLPASGVGKPECGNFSTVQRMGNDRTNDIAQQPCRQLQCHVRPGPADAASEIESARCISEA